MLSSPRKNGLTPLFKKVGDFKEARNTRCLDVTDESCCTSSLRCVDVPTRSP